MASPLVAPARGGAVAHSSATTVGRMRRGTVVVAVLALASSSAVLGLAAAPAQAAPASGGRPVHTSSGGLRAVGALPDAAGARAAATAGASEAAQRRPGFVPRSVSQRHVTLADQAVTDRIAIATVTWPVTAESPALVLRTFTAGKPSAWQPLSVDDSTAPEASKTAGSEPLLLTDVDRVQVAALSGTVVEATLSVYGSPVASADAAAAATAATTTTTNPATVTAADLARPAIRSRAAWGANESIVKLPYEYATVSGAMIHHTAGSNSYSAADVPAILRAIQAYHVNGRGWKDIAYNVLVDKYGTAWEGRGGGLDQAVVGGHSYGLTNYRVFGLSLIGTYSTVKPSAAMVATAESVIAWKFLVHGVDPYGKATGESGTLNAISGHRDDRPTECPGSAAYALLPMIRAAVKEKMADATARAHPALAIPDVDGDGRADVVSAFPNGVRVTFADGTTRESSLTDLGFVGPWSRIGDAVAVGDLNADDYADVAVGATLASGEDAVYVAFGSASGLRAAGNVRVAAPAGLASGAGFGTALAVLTYPRPGLAIGAPLATVSGRAQAGVLVTVPFAGDEPGSAGTWTQGSAGVPDTAEAGDRFGAPLAASGSVLVVGTPRESVGTVAASGLVTAFTWTGSALADGKAASQATRGVPSASEAGDNFGGAVAVHDGLILAGVPGEDLGTVKDAGSVAELAYSRGALFPGTTRSQSSAGVPGSDQAGDAFGSAVAILEPCANSSAVAYAIGVPGKSVAGLARAGNVTTYAVSGAGGCLGSKALVRGGVLGGSPVAGARLGGLLAALPADAGKDRLLVGVAGSGVSLVASDGASATWLAGPGTSALAAA